MVVMEDIKIKKKLFYNEFIYNDKKTCTYWFLLPILKLNTSNLRKNYGFKNAYLGNHLIEKNYKDCIHLLFDTKNVNKLSLNSFIENIKSHQYFIDIYDCYGDNNLGIVFDIDDKFIEVLKIFKNGKYSKFPEWFKNKYFSKEQDQWKIFNKHEDFRKKIEIMVEEEISQDLEVWTKPFPETEIYMYNKNIKIKW